MTIWNLWLFFYWSPSFWKSVASFWLPLSLGRGWRLDKKWCHPKLILQRDSPTVKCDSPRFVFVLDINSNVYDCMLFEYMMYIYILYIYIYLLLYIDFPDWWNYMFYWDFEVLWSRFGARLTYRTGWRRVASSTSVRHLSRKKIIEIVKRRRQQLTRNNIPPKKISNKTHEGAHELRFHKNDETPFFFGRGEGSNMFKPCFPEPGWGKGERLVVHATRLGDWLMKPLEQR